MEMNEQCPLCHEKGISTKPADFEGSQITCQNCGSYRIARRAAINLRNALPLHLACLSHSVWKAQNPTQMPVVTEGIVASTENDKLPTPGEQLDNFIIYLGSILENNPGNAELLPPEHLKAKMGVIHDDDVRYVVNQAKRLVLIEHSDISAQATGGRLTIEGWQRYEELKRGKASGKTAFLAMSFKEEHRQDQDFIIKTFKPAVAETGFRLQDIRDDPKAGLIDGHIRVAIRMARSVVADLSHENQGAYWEAGYAEGFCRADVFNDPKTKPHFDTNHHLTVVWNPQEPEKAAAQLADTIRATRPFDAKMPNEDA